MVKDPTLLEMEGKVVPRRGASRGMPTCVIALRSQTRGTSSSRLETD